MNNSSISNLMYSLSIKKVIKTTMSFGYTVLIILTKIFNTDFLHFLLRF